MQKFYLRIQVLQLLLQYFHYGSNLNETTPVVYTDFGVDKNRKIHRQEILDTLKGDYYVDLLTGATPNDVSDTKLAVYNLWLE